MSRKISWLLCLALLVAGGAGCRKKTGTSSSAAAQPSAPVERPQGPVGLEDAQRYVLALVNRDRAAEGLSPVEWDDVAAKAAQRHVSDMAQHGFTAHWGTDGSVPEERYSEAGGVHLVQENSACFFDGVVRELDPNPQFDPVMLEKIEIAFISETPPNDGHRKNILKPVHNRLGVGLAKPLGVSQPCMAQEFLDAYGEYDGLPAHARAGQAIEVSGEVFDPVGFGGVGIARIDAAKPMKPEQLNGTSTYRMPDPYVLFFPAGYKTPKPVTVNGKHFSLQTELGKQPGRYEVSVWGRFPGSGDELVMVSLRTVAVP